MILNPEHITPTAAPQIADVASVLTDYRTWKGNNLLTADDLLAFMAVWSAERDEFLSAYMATVQIVNNNFATQTY
jgi:hypothetical protein